MTNVDEFFLERAIAISMSAGIDWANRKHDE
jgi:hypothetical protein